MKPLLILTALLLSGISTSAMAGDFSGSFGRSHLPACNSVNGNWTGAGDSCPPLGNGSGAPEARASTVPVPPPHECPPKETETPA